MDDLPIEHKIELVTAEDAHLQILFFSMEEQTWLFQHRFMIREGLKTTLLNEQKAVLRYKGGRPSREFGLNVSMHIIIPERLGQRSVYGVDISPGAKTFFQFEYEWQEDDLVLAEIAKGATQRVRLADFSDGSLVKPVSFPFPVLDRITPEYGSYSVPFRRQGSLDSEEFGQFEFPTTTLMRRG